MTRIRLYAHPLAPCAPQDFSAPSLAQWLLDHYGAVPQVRVQIFKGEPCAENEISNDLAAIMAGDADEYVVLQSPAGTGVEWLIYAAIIATVAAVATILLVPKPVMPGNVNRSQQSPNNALGNRENKVRLLERVEDIYGTVKAIPSLMMPTYNKYIANKKFEYGYYCVGRGYYSLADIKDGDTLIADIDGASASVFNPFTSPNSGDLPVLQVGDAIIDDVLTVSRAIEVDGIALKAPNEVQLTNPANYGFYNGFSGNGNIFSRTPILKPAIGAVFAPGDTVTVSMTPYAVTTGEVYDTSDPPVLIDPGTTTYYDYSGTYTVNFVNDDSINVITPTAWAYDIPTHNCSVSLTGATNTTSWVTLPDADRTEVWVSVTAPNGLFKDSGGKTQVSVGFQLFIEQLHPTTLAPLGVVETISATLSGAVSDERAVTIEQVTGWTGPSRVAMKRVTDHDFAFSGTVQDEIKWADLYSVSPITKTQFGNKTTIHTITQATARATAVKSRQLNCIASRLLPTYDGGSFSAVLSAAGERLSGTLNATSKIVDIIAAVSADQKIGARDLSTEVDMPQLWATQQLLDAWHADAGTFNYTFDSDNTSFEETVVNIANAAFCIAYRQNGKIRLAFERAQASSTALFTHRNKKPLSESVTRKFSSDAEYDGVEFTYVDPDSNQSETITLPLSGAYTKLKKFEIPGIRSYAQAWLRASREYAKLTGQRLTLETTTTLDARSLLPNARVDVVDNTRFKAYDGEVVGQSGLELTLSQDVAFIPATTHSIVLMRRDGTLQSVPVTAGSEPNKVILQSLPSEAITTSYGADGIRTIYSFAADSARGAMAWLVQEIDLSDSQYCTVRAINYSADYYAADYAAIPPKATVIN